MSTAPVDQTVHVKRTRSPMLSVHCPHCDGPMALAAYEFRRGEPDEALFSCPVDGTCGRLVFEVHFSRSPARGDATWVVVLEGPGAALRVRCSCGREGPIVVGVVRPNSSLTIECAVAGCRHGFNLQIHQGPEFCFRDFDMK
jgi:hypothetical protein